MPTESERKAARGRAARLRREAASGGAGLPYVPAGTLESARLMRAYEEGPGPSGGGAPDGGSPVGAYRYDFGGLPPAGLEELLAREALPVHAAGALPEQRARLYRTAHGMLSVATVGDRGAALHRLVWGAYPPGGCRVLTSLRFAPAGSWLELDLRSGHYRLAERILVMDRRDVRSLPGTDPEALSAALEGCRAGWCRCDAGRRAHGSDLDRLGYCDPAARYGPEADRKMVEQALEGLDGEVWE